MTDAQISTNTLQEDSEMLEAAIDARTHAHAPYSKFAVGAALRLNDGTLMTGVNVENASYGLTVCAERHAVAAAIAAGYGKGDFQCILIVASTGTGDAVSPCGACRQVLSEFAGPEFLVGSHNLNDGRFAQWPLGELLAHAFNAERLPTKVRK